MSRDYLFILKKIIIHTIPREEYAVFLFGSRAAKNFHERSDIDVEIWGEQALSPILRYRLEEKIENSEIPFLVDIVDFYRVHGSFKNESLKQIEVWNCPKNMKAILKA